MLTATTQLKRAVYREQLSTLKVLDELVELERTREYLRHSSSLYGYLTGELCYSEGAAMRRLQAARLIAKFPKVRELLQRRQVSLCTLSMIAKECLKSGKDDLIGEILGKSKREVEAILAFRRVDTGRSPVKEQVRVIAAPPQTAVPRISKSPEPQSTAATTTMFLDQLKSATPSPPPSPMYRMSFTASSETYECYQEVLAGMSHKLGTATDQVAQVFEAGLKLLQKELHKKRKVRGLSSSTAERSRYVPVSLKRALFAKADCKCQYRLQDGSVCGSDFQLEIDHIVPHALGGKTTEGNLRVVCRNHNQFLAKQAGLGR